MKMSDSKEIRAAAEMQQPPVCRKRPVILRLYVKMHKFVSPLFLLTKKAQKKKLGKKKKAGEFRRLRTPSNSCSAGDKGYAPLTSPPFEKRKRINAQTHKCVAKTFVQVAKQLHFFDRLGFA